DPAVVAEGPSRLGPITAQRALGPLREAGGCGHRRAAAAGERSGESPDGLVARWAADSLCHPGRENEMRSVGPARGRRRQTDACSADHLRRAAPASLTRRAIARLCDEPNRE